MTGKKKRLNITVDQALYDALDLKNKSPSRYINNLLRQHYIGENEGKLVDVVSRKVIEKFKGDEILLQDLATRISAWRRYQ